MSAIFYGEPEPEAETPEEAPTKSVGEQIHEKEQRKELVEHLIEEKKAAHPEKARRTSNYYKPTSDLAPDVVKSEATLNAKAIAE